MVGKKNEKRPPMPVEPALASRPKRQISPKSLEYSGGLSWREERELKKALHASLQDFRRLGETEGDQPLCQESFRASQWRSGLVSKSSGPSLCPSISIDESSQASSISSTQDSLKNKIHAQRKFAQGASGSNPGTPSTTPVKVPFKSSPIKLFPKRAKTEDFLTFLCLRGTSALPSHLDFFNFSREEPTTGETSGPHTPKGFTRESSPASSSTSLSNNHEDVPDIYYSHLPRRGRPPNSSRQKEGRETLKSYKISESRKLFKGDKHRQFVISEKPSQIRLKQRQQKEDRISWKNLKAGGRKRKESESTWEDMDFEDEFVKSSPSKKVRLRTSNRGKDGESQGHWKDQLPRKQKGLRTVKKGQGNSKVLRSGPMTRSAEKLKPAFSLSATKVAAKRKLTIIKRLRQNPGRNEQILLAKLIEKKRRQNGKKLNERVHISAEEASPSVNSSKKKVELKYLPVEPQSIKFEPFPQPGEPAQVVEIPIFYPNEEEFRNPMAYIQKITPVAEPYGMCKLVPPPSWKMDNNVREDLRMITQTQYTHKLFQRWGPNVQQVKCLRKHLQLTGSDLDQIPVIGGVEVDLPKLYSTIQEFGGMQNVVDKKRWIKVADAMKIPKLAQDRGTKLYDAYCKYLLSYDMLAEDEKNKLEQAVIADRQREIKAGLKEEEWISKGKSNPLSAFSRAARNTMYMWCKDISLSAEQIENDYWKIVEDRECHISVQYGYMHGSLFPTKKDSPYFRHPWNLLNISQNQKSLLHCLGPIEGVTMPTVQFRMLFTSTCWSTDHHRLPYIHYLHSGSEVIWYSVPKQEEDKFQTVLKKIDPSLDTESPRWLKEDIVTVSPGTLVDHDVSVGRCVQHPRQFLLVFPHTFTATMGCGYSLSELVHYAMPDWIATGHKTAEELNSCSEREFFSMDALLTFLIQDKTVALSTLETVLPTLELVIQRELAQRKRLQDSGLKLTRYMWTSERRKILLQECTEYYICEESKKVCFFSMVVNETECTVLSLDRGLSHIQKKRNLKSCKLIVRYTDVELNDLVKECQQRITAFGGIGSPSAAQDCTPGKKKSQRKSEVKT